MRRPVRNTSLRGIKTGDSQSLDASDDGVEGGLNVGSRACGHDGLGLFVQQVGHILNTQTRHGEETHPQEAEPKTGD